MNQDIKRLAILWAQKDSLRCVRDSKDGLPDRCAKSSQAIVFLSSDYNVALPYQLSSKKYPTIPNMKILKAHQTQKPQRFTRIRPRHNGHTRYKQTRCIKPSTLQHAPHSLFRNQIPDFFLHLFLQPFTALLRIIPPSLSKRSICRSRIVR